MWCLFRSNIDWKYRYGCILNNCKFLTWIHQLMQRHKKSVTVNFLIFLDWYQWSHWKYSVILVKIIDTHLNRNTHLVLEILSWIIKQRCSTLTQHPSWFCWIKTGHTAIILHMEENQTTTLQKKSNESVVQYCFNAFMQKKQYK